MQNVFMSYAKDCMKELEIVPKNHYRDALEDIVSNLGSRLS
jgi:hypothetical protein